MKNLQEELSQKHEAYENLYEKHKEISQVRLANINRPIDVRKRWLIDECFFRN